MLIAQAIESSKVAPECRAKRAIVYSPLGDQPPIKQKLKKPHLTIRLSLFHLRRRTIY